MDSTDLIKIVLSVIPSLSKCSHKGQAGRVGIVGGCSEYTGAPYFAAISALKTGCDLVHVFCTQDASSVIKAYSPELIVYPILDDPNVKRKIELILPKMHTLVIGPGLGREKAVFDAAHEIVNMAKDMQLPLVLDADALFYINHCPDLIHGYKKAILTPNTVEFKRLYNSVHDSPLNDEPTHRDVKFLSGLLGNVTIVHKGVEDVISDGENLIVCKEHGSPRRCGGQGDLLSGSMGVFNFWAHNFYDNKANSIIGPYSATVIAALASCMLTRKCSFLAFNKHRRSMTTSDMINEIRTAFSILFPVD